ncbi:MAG: ABC transporter permease [Methanomassiliicoccus sp.]|nr:ABC transporter permease [Methanomassiliicoccus sp.]
MNMEWGSEIGTVFYRWIIKLRRRPIYLFFSLIQPLVWFLLFTQAFSAIGDIPGFAQITGTSDYITFFTAAVIIQTVASSALQSGIGMVNDIDSGYLDKMKTAPIRKSSILLGKVLSDGVSIVIQVAIILGLALLVGVRIATGVPGIILILLLSMVFGIAWSGISLFVGLKTKNSETTLSVGLLTTFPLLFLSTAVMPKPLLPEWVQKVATINPISYISDALQGLIIRGFEWSAIGNAIIVTIIIGIISLGASIALFRRAVS